jgi:prophage regulatory protein
MPQAIPATDTPRLLRLREVQHLTGLGKSQVYHLARNGQFPSVIKLSERCSAWPESLVREWINSRIAAAQSGKKVAA